MSKIMNSFVLILGVCAVMNAQENEKEKAKALRTSKDLTYEANKELGDNKFVEAEADYRRAISKSEENIAAPYNLGTAYYNKESFEEAFGRFKQAGELTADKGEKHKAFHNMGNVFMQNEEYKKAVEAYKEALRNNPKDEETRYNLALAKELAKKQKDQQNQGDNEDKKEEKDQKDQDKEQNQEGENKEDQQDQQQKDENKKEGDEGDQQKEENKEEEGDEKKEQPKQGEQPEEKPQPRPNQLSPQQVKNLLEAMQNEERKVQEKMDAKKVKGIKTKNAKDW
jgi:tetratricopeptide (TPR) repeat protein